MAGGPHAQTVPCITCGARAERTYEGIEDDHYRCEFGHRFGIDWSHGGPPQGPQWPPPGFAAEPPQAPAGPAGPSPEGRPREGGAQGGRAPRALRIAGVVLLAAGGLMLLDGSRPHPGSGFPGGLIFAVEVQAGWVAAAAGALLVLLGALMGRRPDQV